MLKTSYVSNQSSIQNKNNLKGHIFYNVWRSLFKKKHYDSDSIFVKCDFLQKNHHSK